MNIEQAFFAVTLDDGSVAIMGFVTQGRGSSLPKGAEWVDEAEGWWKREPTDANVFLEIGRTAFADGRSPTGYRRVQPTDLPQDRTYRNAWKDDGQAIVHDMPKAREIHRDRLRQLRAAQFEANDIALRDAILAQDQQAIAKATKRRDDLRDATDDPAIEAAQTVDELRVAGMATVSEV